MQIDQVSDFYQQFYQEKDLAKVHTWMYPIFKYFIMFVLMSEMVIDTFKKALQLAEITEQNRKQSRTMYKIFYALFSLHMAFDFLIFLLSNIYIILSSSLFDAVNNSLSILILNMMHTMGSKYFLLSFYGSENDIYNDPDYLKMTLQRSSYKSFEFFFQPVAYLQSVLQLLLLLIQS